MAFNKMHAGWMHPRLVYLGFVVSAITYLTLRRARHKAQQRVDRRITIDHALDLLDSLIVTVLVTREGWLQIVIHNKAVQVL
jgi:hypothetical protein